MADAPSTKEILLDAIEQTLGSKILETVEPSDVSEPTNEKPFEVKEAPICITQNAIPAPMRDGDVQINVGLDSEVPRWTPGSVIKWAAWRAGFASPDDANFAAEQCQIAAEAWNNADVGVTFEWVPLAKDATFVLCHGGNKGTVLASAFFPNAKDLDYVFVYNYGLKPAYKAGLWRVLLHELGHVLGLRHEFALEKEKGAIGFGPPNERSVMNYRPELPELQPSDIESTKNFYSLKDDAHGNPPKIGMTAIVDYDPR